MRYYALLSILNYFKETAERNDDVPIASLYSIGFDSTISRAISNCTDGPFTATRSFLLPTKRLWPCCA